MTENGVTANPSSEGKPEENWWAAAIQRMKANASPMRIGLVGLAGAAATAIAALQMSDDRLPEGIAKSNGRIEAERIDIASKYGGRLTEVLVKEGEAVTPGQVLARVDTAELESQLREAEAGLRQGEQMHDQAAALLAERRHELALAKKQLERAETLKQAGYATEEMVDLRQTAKLSATAGESAALAQVSQSRSGVDAAAARVARIKTVLDDSTIKAPRQARIQHRVALPGQVLPPSGRILTALDPTDVYMTLFLPLHEAGRLAINAEARLVFDSAPGLVVPASVSFIADEAQFTPKFVETKNEREKLMFRVKVQISRSLLERHAGLVKVGTPGVAYIKFERNAPWPQWLEPTVPESASFGQDAPAPPQQTPQLAPRPAAIPVREAPPLTCGQEVAMGEAQQSNTLAKGPRLSFSPRTETTETTKSTETTETTETTQTAQTTQADEGEGASEQQNLMFTSALISQPK